MKSTAHHRRSVRLPSRDYSSPGAYFLTIVTHNRACLFGSIQGGLMGLSLQGHIAEECWQQIDAHFPTVELGAHVVMPNHVHGILILHEQAAISSPLVGAQHAAPLQVQPGSIGAIVRSYKSAVTNAIHKQTRSPARVWQRNYYEHIIRNERDWEQIHLYIESNTPNWARDEENPLLGA